MLRFIIFNYVVIKISQSQIDNSNDLIINKSHSKVIPRASPTSYVLSMSHTEALLLLEITRKSFRNEIHRGNSNL
jgi:hypothetical protein